MRAFSPPSTTRQNPRTIPSQTFRLNNPLNNQRDAAASSSLNGAAGFLSQPPSSSMYAAPNAAAAARLIHSNLLPIQRQFQTHAPTPAGMISAPTMRLYTPTISTGGSITDKRALKKPFSTLWTCDVCRVAEFESYEEAEAHEKICNGSPSRSSSFNVSSKIETRKTDPIIIPKGNRPIAEPKGHDAKNSQENIKCYSCEKCQRLFFSIDEANDHEKVCKGNNVNGTETTIKEEKKTDATSSSNQVIDLCDDYESENDHKTSSNNIIPYPQDESSTECHSLTPFLRDFSKYNNINKTSSGLRLILASVDLCPRDKSIGFRCHFCKQDLVRNPNDCSTDVSNVNQMPNIAVNHFVKCKTPHGGRLLTSLSKLSHTGMSWIDFFRGFCEANNIRTTGPSMIIMDPNSWNEKWKTTNNGTTESKSTNEVNISQVLGEYNAIKLLISASRSLDFIESDVVPMIFPKIAPLMKYVQPFYVSGLNQLSLAARTVRTSESSSDHYYRVVCIQCIHCGKQNRLSTKSLSLDIINFIGSHILEECTAVPKSTLTSLKNWASASKRIDSKFPLTLNQICDLIESYYHFSLVRYKDQKYIVVSNNIGTKSKHADLENTSKDEPTSNERTKKRSLVDDTSKSLEPEIHEGKRVNIGQLSVVPRKYMSEDGKACKLIPFGGVPLINSFTKKKAELLGRELITVLSNVELGNIGEAISKEHGHPIALRCHLCVASPKYYNFSLDTVNDLPRAILASAEHLKNCPCAPANVTSLNLQSILKTKDDIRILREFCFFIVHLTGMKDKSIKGKGCVVWGRSEYELKENYIAKELALH